MLSQIIAPKNWVIVLLTGSESCLLYLAMLVFSSEPRFVPPMIWMWLLGVIAYFIPRLFQGRSHELYAGMTISCFLATSVLSVKYLCYPQIAWSDADWIRDYLLSLLGEGNLSVHNPGFVSLASIIIWLRQVLRNTPDSEDIEYYLRIAVIPISILTVIGIGRLGNNPSVTSLIVLSLAGCYTLGIASLAVSNSFRQEGEELIGKGIVGRWLISSLFPIAILALLGIGLSLLLYSPQTSLIDILLKIVSTILGWILLIISLIVQLILVPVIYLIAKIFEPALNRLNLNPLPERPPRNAQEDLERIIRQRGEGLPQHTLEIALIVGVLLIVLFLLIRHRPSRDKLTKASVQREHAYGDLELGKTLRNLLARLARRGKKMATDPLMFLLRDSRWRYTAEVRRTYREVLGLYREIGKPRLPYETPLEHSTHQGLSSLVELADLYDLARYSRKPLTAQDAARARELAEEIRSKLRVETNSSSSHR
ncbi:hypothetical protein Tter_0492 [Thermobaculum terrenum ATCC BAA-798]|uniref:Protein-glutamine gamma-glutamyltransferase-like C-terminal domain-containing protein n=1 Tax=Thermobaculum terrenum (strain ATCC BAA-798 / CCMEE 7001 / YNP1) TaxID=525904 RepID=D1CEQ7_THET1|nr:DUF4129 domain-containing protein [Thermobaculum terrenum]ACZ41413.1 hypothetical protein Tter_0492 [Thermobaculum terrenum ATCC BAA-798]